MIFCTHTLDHKIRLIATGISLHEDTESYLFALNSIKNFLKNNLKFVWNP